MRAALRAPNHVVVVSSFRRSQAYHHGLLLLFLFVLVLVFGVLLNISLFHNGKFSKTIIVNSLRCRNQQNETNALSATKAGTLSTNAPSVKLAPGVLKPAALLKISL